MFVLIIEFLLGEQIMVAPVLVEGATKRNIYLPTGLWRDENHPGNSLLSGRTWLINYPAGLEILPWFTRVSPESQPKPCGLVCSLPVTSYIIVYAPPLDEIHDLPNIEHCKNILDKSSL